MHTLSDTTPPDTELESAFDALHGVIRQLEDVAPTHSDDCLTDLADAGLWVARGAHRRRGR
jgi:hypothetical protein